MGERQAAGVQSRGRFFSYALDLGTQTSLASRTSPIPSSSQLLTLRSPKA